MQRMTEKRLRRRVQTLNMMLERPLDQWQNNGELPLKASIGHLCLERSGTGYSLQEQVSDNGACSVYVECLTGKQMELYIDGVILGIGFKTRHIGELLVRNELVKQGLSVPDAPLYNQDTSQLKVE